MSKRPKLHYHGSSVPWFTAFIILKVMGNAYIATWSWWWLFLPFVPTLALVFKTVGWL
jgi:hypothetical protein